MTGYVCIAMLEDPPYNMIIAATNDQPEEWLNALPLLSHLLCYEEFTNPDTIFKQFIQRLKADQINVKIDKAFPARPYEVIRVFNQIRDEVFNNQQTIKKLKAKRIGKFIVKEGIAEDTKTGLIWLRFAHGQLWKNNTVMGDAETVNWNDAFELAEQFNQQGGYAGYRDWRLPTIEELKTLIDLVKDQSSNSIDTDVFPENTRWFWSSSPYINDSDGAWIMDFYDGSGYDDYKDSSNAVRLVRGNVIDK
jgi:hypothetical protein